MSSHLSMLHSLRCKQKKWVDWIFSYTCYPLNIYALILNTNERDTYAPVKLNFCAFVTFPNFLHQTWPQGSHKESTTIPPDPRGDASGPGIDEVSRNTIKAFVQSCVCRHKMLASVSCHSHLLFQILLKQLFLSFLQGTSNFPFLFEP